MYPNLDENSSNYENTLNKLSNQIKELFSQIQMYQAIISEKDHQINQLVKENNQLKMEIQNISNQLNPRYNKPLTPSVPAKQPVPAPTSNVSPSIEDPRIMKRQCPNCGASGFAIREVEDKTKIISYVPRRIYAKKMVCTKCRFEF
jgi:regulator of replication initiation timing